MPMLFTSSGESGNIAYDTSWFRMGCYKDDDEQYLYDGMIAEVSVYDEALSDTQVLANFRARKDEFGVAEIVEIEAGPYVHFSKKGEVTVYWKTAAAVASKVEYGVKLRRCFIIIPVFLVEIIVIYPFPLHHFIPVLSEVPVFMFLQ